jgi:coenzyme F420-0:L-glutamate ligase/coenzyme F420-1:gamma-L-glutamate ligase
MLQFLTSRRSYKRAFAERPVDTSLIEKIVETSRWAPSAHNAQPWRFVAIIDKERRQTLAREMGSSFRDDLTKSKFSPSEIEARVAHSIKVFTSAPVLILVCGETAGTMDLYPDRNRQDAEITMLVQSVANGICYFTLAAHACGLASSWYCAPLFAKATVREVLHLPPTWDPQAFVTLGYPQGAPISPPKRQTIEAILKFV